MSRVIKAGRRCSLSNNIAVIVNPQQRHRSISDANERHAAIRPAGCLPLSHMQTYRVICHDVYANMSLLCSSQSVFVEYVMNLVSKQLGTTVKTCNVTLRHKLIQKRLS